MKLTESYIRKLIMEELLNEQASSSQQAIAQRINQSAKTSPFIIMMNEASPQDQFFVLEQFLEKITIKDPTTFYKNLSNMALNKVNPQAAKPAQTKTQSTVIKEMEQQRPPQLRKASDMQESCGTCEYFCPITQSCKAFGGYPVSAGMVCDKWTASGKRQ